MRSLSQNGTAAAEGAPPPTQIPSAAIAVEGVTSPWTPGYMWCCCRGVHPPLPGMCLPLLLLLQPAASYQVYHAQCGCEAVHQKNEQMLPTTSGYIIIS